jgi:LysM repeat protein
MSLMTVHRVGSPGLRRVGVVVAPAVVGALLLAACGGGSEGGASATTLDLSQSSTAFVVRQPATTLAPDAAPAAGEVATGTQEYTVVSGDFPLGVAKKFGVSLDLLVSVNEWASYAEFPQPGTVILIPPGGTVPVPSTTLAAGATGDTTAPGDTTGTESGTPADTIPNAGDNCAEGKYTIAAGDVPIKVAKKFDVTVEALNAANANTNRYSSFEAGTEIVIPAKADC